MKLRIVLGLLFLLSVVGSVYSASSGLDNREYNRLNFLQNNQQGQLHSMQELMRTDNKKIFEDLWSDVGIRNIIRTLYKDHVVYGSPILAAAGFGAVGCFKFMLATGEDCGAMSSVTGENITDFIQKKASVNCVMYESGIEQHIVTQKSPATIKTLKRILESHKKNGYSTCLVETMPVNIEAQERKAHKAYQSLLKEENKKSQKKRAAKKQLLGALGSAVAPDGVGSTQIPVDTVSPVINQYKTQRRTLALQGYNPLPLREKMLQVSFVGKPMPGAAVKGSLPVPGYARYVDCIAQKYRLANVHVG